MKRSDFRSEIEFDIAKSLAKNKIKFRYEEFYLPYTLPVTHKRYTPDFEIVTKSGKKIVIEVKGIWVYADRLKHLMIRQQYPEIDLRFVFSCSKNKIRKGSKTTYADICEGKGKGVFKEVRWKYADKKIPKSWFME